jgi:O-antigen/teichoic acid export membrane protein
MIIMVAYTLPLVQAFANSILEARSKFAFKAIIYIIFVILGTAVGTWLIRYYGVVGLTIGSTAGWILSQFIMNVYYHRVIGINILRFLKELTSGLLLSFIVILAIGWCFNYIPGDSWFNLVVKIGLYSCIYAAIMFKFGLNKGEADMFLSSIPTRFRRRNI